MTNLCILISMAIAMYNSCVYGQLCSQKLTNKSACRPTSNVNGTFILGRSEIGTVLQHVRLFNLRNHRYSVSKLSAVFRLKKIELKFFIKQKTRVKPS